VECCIGGGKYKSLQFQAPDSVPGPGIIRMPATVAGSGPAELGVYLKDPAFFLFSRGLSRSFGFLFIGSSPAAEGIIARGLGSGRGGGQRWATRDGN
jgi:hypothetical protein